VVRSQRRKPPNNTAAPGNEGGTYTEEKLNNIITLKQGPDTETITLSITLPADDMRQLRKSLAINQHVRNTHGAMTLDKLAQFWFEDVAAAMVAEEMPIAATNTSAATPPDWHGIC
jgi:hypothetical protein